jgi:transposase-like protein
VIRVNGDDHWLYGTVNPETNEILHLWLFPTTTKQTTRWFLAELHRRYQLDHVEFLVDDDNYLMNVLEEDGYLFQMISYGNRNAIEHIFWEMKLRTSSFANSFNYVEPSTAELWLQALAVRHNSRQS